MVFSSIVFMFYFLPAVVVLYYTVGRIHLRIGNLLLLAASLMFYAWGEPENVLLLIGSCVMNWILALGISRFPNHKKVWLIAACLINLGVLFWFKYLNFTVRNINGFLGSMGARQLPVETGIVLPIGISFFTFQALSYVIDVYRGTVKVQKNLLYVALYISLFPQLVAGPIVRYHQVEEQILNRTHSWQKFEQGAARFVIGLGKKLLLANTFATITDQVYALTLAGHQLVKVPVLLAWLGAIAYMLQIFFDFSAYSDMAIGLGKIFGFTFEENFNYPYISKSIGEFWRRWHISLSSWFREYVYFPLGGSHVENPDIMVRNLFVVWVLTGIWHGAAWTFILWGLFNFACILLERLFCFEQMDRISGFWKHIYALLAVNFGWVLFRSESFYQYKEYMGNMFGLNHSGWYSDTAVMFLREYAVFWVAGLLFSMPSAAWIKERCSRYPKLASLYSCVCYPVGMSALLWVCVVYLVKGGYNPFIYFNF